jgi:SAM-dependent MidA family methyltransferase
VTLREKIEQEIRERGPIPFSRYVEMCLYDRELGYYARNANQFGKAGDFYTASDVHAVFGRLLARQFEEMWRALGRPASIEVLELGPGRGLFAQDLLDWSEKKFPQFFQALHYSLAESSIALREKLKEVLKRHFEAGKASLSPAELSGKGTTSFVPKSPRCESASAAEGRLSVLPTIIFANEFFDALPVEIVSDQGSLRISTQNARFTETWVQPSADELEFLNRFSVRAEPRERIEVPVLAQQYMGQLAASIQHGFFVIIDYGYTRPEQLAGRHRGTLMTYRQHSASPNPYEAPGEQDITAHVNFTALTAAAEQNGMQVEKLLTQSQFLMGIGENNQFADAFEDARLPQERAKVALQLKHLVTPVGMGESFHVLVGSKGVDQPCPLAGLSFGKSL